jgi:hypothetical protein
MISEGGRHVMTSRTLSVLVFALLAGCGQGASDITAPSASASGTVPDTVTVSAAVSSAASDPVDRAKAAAQAFSGQLRARLQAAMQEGGPTAAVEVCHAEAPRIAETVMAEHGVRLGRVAMPGRNRNVAQAAQGWQLATLESFQQAVSGGAAAAEQVAVVREGLPEGVALRMMRGIATEPVCVACHGTAVSPAVRDIIARHYPGDGATGFEVGDLRGALWVEVPID